MAGQIPGTQLVTLVPGRHMGLVEHHERFNKAVSEFAAQCLGAHPVGVAR